MIISVDTALWRVLIPVLKKVWCWVSHPSWNLYIYLLDKFKDFSPKGEVSFDVNRAGFFIFKPDYDIWLNPGDFLGFSGPGIVGYR